MVVVGAIAPVPDAFEPTLHVTEVLGLFVPTTDALNCTFVFVLVSKLEGLIVTSVTVGIGAGIGVGVGVGVGSCEVGAGLTESNTLPDFEVSKTEVAKIKRVLAVSLAETVSRPLSFITVPEATAPLPAALELTLHITAVSGSFKPATAAVNCNVLPAVIVWFTGLTVTESTVGTITLITVLPDFVGSNTEVAIIKRVGKVSLTDTVSKPLLFISVPAETAPLPAAFELTFHVTVGSGSFVPVTIAVN
jgi:hypothetical protein